MGFARSALRRHSLSPGSGRLLLIRGPLIRGKGRSARVPPYAPRLRGSVLPPTYSEKRVNHLSHSQCLLYTRLAQLRCVAARPQALAGKRGCARPRSLTPGSRASRTVATLHSRTPPPRAYAGRGRAGPAPAQSGPPPTPRALLSQSAPQPGAEAPSGLSAKTPPHRPPAAPSPPRRSVPHHFRQNVYR
jgi:hypothetical protein